MNKKTIIALFIVAALLIAALLFAFLYQNRQMQQMVEQMEFEKEELEEEYEDMVIQFDGYQNLDIRNDSLQDLLSKEQDRVQDLLEELRITKVTNARRIAELKKELATVRQVMVGYVHQIDSLNKTNIRLEAENKQMRQQNQQIAEQNRQITEQNMQLTETVTRASMIEISNFSVIMLNRHDRKTRFESQAKKLQIDFTLERNVTTSTGLKTVYLRLVDPQGNLLQANENDRFVFENDSIGYSVTAQVEYAGEALPCTMYWKLLTDEQGNILPIQNGYYNADFFVDGSLLGSFPFTLK